MFNTYNAGNTNLKINACSGGIYKTYKESWFSYLRLDSSAMRTMFRGYIYESDENVYYQNVIILQMILTSKEDYVIAELINKEDFEKYFEGVNKI
jgi:hypothetical protein